MNTILSHKEKAFILQRKMDEVRTMNKIVVDLSQEKIDLMMLIRKYYSTGEKGGFSECFN